MNSLPALGIALAVCAAVCFQLGLLLQKRAAALLPRVGGPVGNTARRFLASPGWLSGVALVLAGWVLQFLALLHAPLAVVMPCIAFGIVFQTALCMLLLGERLRTNEGYGIVLCTLGIGLLGASIGATSETTGQNLHGFALCVTVAGLAAFAATCMLVARTTPRRAEALLGIAAGFLYACTGLLTKALGITGVDENDLPHALTIMLVMIVVGGCALVTLQAAYQRGRAIVVTPVVCVLADFLPAAAGPSLFDEGWPDGIRSILRASALASILIGVLLLATSKTHEVEATEVVAADP